MDVAFVQYKKEPLHLSDQAIAYKSERLKAKRVSLNDNDNKWTI